MHSPPAQWILLHSNPQSQSTEVEQWVITLIQTAGAHITAYLGANCAISISRHSGTNSIGNSLSFSGNWNICHPLRKSVHWIVIGVLKWLVAKIYSGVFVSYLGYEPINFGFNVWGKIFIITGHILNARIARALQMLIDEILDTKLIW